MNAMGRAFGFCLAFTGSLLAAAEEKPLPKDLPPYGADRPMPKLDVDVHTLPNGLTVWLVRRPGYPKVSATLVVRGGTASDPADRQGLSTMMAGLLNEGTGTRTSRQIAETMQGAGGRISGFAAADAVYLGADAFSTGLPTLLEVLADVAQHPAFPAAEVALARTNTLQELQAQESQPQIVARRTFHAAVFGSHPYRFAMIRPEVATAATREAFVVLHAERFQPGRALLVLAGDFDPAAAMKLVTARFGAWKGGAAAPAPVPEAPRSSRHAFLLVPRPGSVQASIRIGRPMLTAKDPDYVPLKVANVILAESFDSRVTKNIREDKGYTYSPFGMTSAYAQGGLLTLGAEVRTEVTGASLLEMFYEMDRMGATPVPEGELQRAKRYAEGIFRFRNQMQETLGYGLAGAWVQGQGPEALTDYVAKVNAVTAEDVRRVSRAWFASKDQTVVVVGDEAKAKAELETFGPVEIVKP